MDVYQSVTDTIIRALEKGTGEAVMPWNRAGGVIPTNATTKQDYQGINILSLWCVAQERGFGTSTWATYRQWQEIGAQVRQGEKSSLIVFYKQHTKEDEAGEAQTFRVLKYYSVFNADQVDGWQAPELTGSPIDRITAADEYIRRTGAYIRHGGAVACYRPITDDIHMPDERRFFDTATSTRTEAYYSVLLHELTHWTAAPHRLDRDLKHRFGSEAYAMEELVAELGAAFQCVRLGITPEPRADHAAYLQNWLTVLKNDRKAIFTAAARAQEATDYLFNCPP